MRLLNTTTRKLESFTGRDIPLYAVFSHRWGTQEVTFQDLERGCACWQHDNGYAKLRNVCSIAAADGIDYIWIDTCCIDKTNNTEFSEALNSMYLWYREAVLCYAYLADVPRKDFAQSEWFERGWTLQELIAPSIVVFLDASWQRIGTKHSLQKTITERTGIPKNVLLTGSFAGVSVAQKMSWAADRITAVVEDRAYCLMGLFGVHMPMIYGERERAFIRLQQEILKVTDDLSLFVWKEDGPDRPGGLLAPSPSAFRHSGDIRRPRSLNVPSVVVNNKGLHLRIPIVIIEGKGPLALVHSGEDEMDIGVWLRPLSTAGDYFERRTTTDFYRLKGGGVAIVGEEGRSERDICVRQNRPGEGRQTSLWRVAAKGREATMKLLLSQGLPVDTQDDTDRTPLSWAVEHGNRDMAELLLEVCADLEARDRFGATPLLRAAMAGRVAMVQLLIDAGADLGARDLQGNSALSQAALHGHTEVVRLLLDKGMNKESRNLEARSPLALAATRGHEKVVKLLLDRGADKEAGDRSGSTPLLHAARWGWAEAMRLLIEAKADLQSKDDIERTALQWAKAEKHQKVVCLLLENGAEDEMNPIRCLTGRNADVLDERKERFQIKKTRTSPLL